MPTSSRRRWGISIRWSLFFNLLLLVVLISGSLLLYSVANANRTIRHLSVSLIEEALGKAQDKLARFFSPISTTIEIVRDLGDRGLFSPSESGTATRLLLPVLKAIPQMSAVNIGDEDGDTLLVIKRQSEWLSISKQGGAEMADWRIVDEQGDILRRYRQPLDFDPRTRPWYALATQGGSESAIHWTTPYAFVPTGDPGITAAVQVLGPRETYVLAFDILLESLSTFTQSIEVSPNGITFVLTEDDRLLVPPAGATGDLRSLVFKRAEELAMPLVAEAVRMHRQRPTGEPFQITRGDETWWCGFQPYSFGSDQRLWIAVLVPATDVLGDARRDQFALLVLTAAAFLVAILMALVLSRGYSTPLRKLVAHSAQLQRLQTDKEVRIRSGLREVGQLADAQESMRRALDSFARYVPIEVVRELLDRGEAATIGGRNAEVTVLFTDIVGFTSIAESMSPAALTSHMASYFDGVIAILQRHGAIVDKIIGDAVMAFWGAPNELPNHARPAVEAVLEIRAWLQKENEIWIEQGLPPLHTRFGLAAGEVAVGNIGAHHRLNYTVLGDPVNLAHRLEALNSKFGTWVLADDRVRFLAGDLFEWREVDTVEIRGKTVRTRIFELLGRRRAEESLRS